MLEVHECVNGPSDKEDPSRDGLGPGVRGPVRKICEIEDRDDDYPPNRNGMGPYVAMDKVTKNGGTETDLGEDKGEEDHQGSCDGGKGQQHGRVDCHFLFFMHPLSLLFSAPLCTEIIASRPTRTRLLFLPPPLCTEIIAPTPARTKLLFLP